MLGGHYSDAKFEIINTITVMLVGDEKQVEAEAVGKESPWILLSFKKKEQRDKVLAQRAVISRQARQVSQVKTKKDHNNRDHRLSCFDASSMCRTSDMHKFSSSQANITK
jgi:hypothetical protein